MIFKWCLYSLTIFLALLSSNYAYSRGTIWTLDLGAQRHSLAATDNVEFLGSAGVIKVGRFFSSGRWASGVSLDLLTGPYEGPESQNIIVDFTGTGLSAYVNFFFKKEISTERSSNYGLGVQFNYADIIGRSTGQKTISASEEGEVRNWIMRVNNFSVTPTLTYILLEPSRKEGNKPELLMTRLEGLKIYIGASFPIQTKYKLQYEQDNLLTTKRGGLFGHSWIVGVSTLFGI